MDLKKFQKVDANPRSIEVRAQNSLNIPFFFGRLFWQLEHTILWGSKIAFPIWASFSVWPFSPGRSTLGASSYTSLLVSYGLTPQAPFLAGFLLGLNSGG